MMFHVPQFVDVEDKIAGPLTGKQLLWMVGMGAAILLARLFTGGGAAMYILSVPIVVLFALFAFYRPNGQSMVAFVFHGIFYLFRPKVMMWRRPQAGEIFPQAVRKETETMATRRTEVRRVGAEDIRNVAAMLDANKEQ